MLSQSNPKVSIIIVGFNGMRYLKNCLESVFAQTYDNYEVVFVDNCSTDGTVEYLRNNYPQIKLIQNPNNKGAAEGRNVGIRHSTGKLYVFLDVDVVVEPDFLKKVVKQISRNNRIGILAPVIIQWGRKVVGGKYNFKTGSVTFDYTEINTEYEPDVVSSCAMCVRRELVEEIGCWDSSFFVYLEDVEYCLRAKMSGWKIVTIPNCEILHMVGSTSIARSTMIYYLSIRNRIWLMRRYADLKNLIRFFIYYEPVSIIGEIIVSAIGRGANLFWRKFGITIWGCMTPVRKWGYIISSRIAGWLSPLMDMENLKWKK